MNTFKHSGAFGDLLYAMPVVKALGGGEFYLHLDQINWIGKHYYGSEPNPFHQGRMTAQDLEFMRPFMEAQTYITKFDAYSKETEITHNLDRFRVPFVHHPGNYVDIYANCFKITDAATQATLRDTAWFTVPSPKKLGDRSLIINRTQRWISDTTKEVWHEQKSLIEECGIFVGLPEEYKLFKEQIGLEVPYHPTNNMLELAEVIAGADQFIGNQSMCLALAIGLGQFWVCEARKDMPLERNECYFPNHPKGQYF